MATTKILSNDEFDWSAVTHTESTLTRADLLKMSASEAANDPNVIAYMYAQYLQTQPGKDLNIRQFRQNFLDSINTQSNSRNGMFFVNVDNGDFRTPIPNDRSRNNTTTEVVLPETPNDPAPQIQEFERLIALCVRHMVDRVPKRHFYSMCIQSTNSKTLGKLKRFVSEHATYYVIGFSSKSLIYCVFTSDTLLESKNMEAAIAPASFKFLLCDTVTEFSETVRKHHITGTMYSCSSYDVCESFKK